MKKAFKIILPLILVLAIIASIGWYLFVYDRDFTRDFLLTQARYHDSKGNTDLGAWFYDLAYEYTAQDQNVAIELANQYKADGNYTKAEHTLTNAIADKPKLELYIALCKTYLEQDKILDAVGMLDNLANPDIRPQLDALRPAAPASTPETGFYSEYITVELTADSGKIYFTTDGRCPSTERDLYNEGFVLPTGETLITAYTIADNGLISPITTMTYTVGGVIEKVTFTDPAVEAALRTQLNVDADEVIYTDALWEITEFTVPEDAASFSDIALLPYLKTLTIHDKTIPSLDFLNGMLQLEALDFTGCKLPESDLPLLANLTTLRRLNLSNCGLSTLAGLKELRGLTDLNLSNNTVRNLEPLKDMTTLVELNLQHNAVIKLEHLSGLVNLEKLDISYNSVTSLSPLGGCIKLTYLDAGNNAISGIADLAVLPPLTWLSLKNNSLTDVSTLATCTTLVELNISSNTVSDIRSLSALTALEFFDFSYNQVSTLPAWADGTPLYSINGSYNALASIDSLKNMAELAYIYMDYNKLTNIDALANCMYLVTVNVYGNEIEDVSALTDQSIIVNYDPTNKK